MNSVAIGYPFRDEVPTLGIVQADNDVTTFSGVNV